MSGARAAALACCALLLVSCMRAAGDAAPANEPGVASNGAPASAGPGWGGEGGDLAGAQGKLAKDEAIEVSTNVSDEEDEGKDDDWDDRGETVERPRPVAPSPPPEAPRPAPRAGGDGDVFKSAVADKLETVNSEATGYGRVLAARELAVEQEAELAVEKVIEEVAAQLPLPASADAGVVASPVQARQAVGADQPARFQVKTNAPAASRSGMLRLEEVLAMADAESSRRAARGGRPATPVVDRRAVTRNGKETATGTTESKREHQLLVGSTGKKKADAFGASRRPGGRLDDNKGVRSGEGEAKSDHDNARSPRDHGAADRRPATPDAPLDLPQETERPTSFLPRMAYFENTYLGGNAAHAEQVRRLQGKLGADAAWASAHAPSQPFDPPSAGAISLSATLDRRSLDRPGRVFLQIGLQGSHRYGWRRPPLDVVLVVDAGAVEEAVERTTELTQALMSQLGPQDRLGLVLTGDTPTVVAEPTPVRKLRVILAGLLGDARMRVSQPDAVGAAIGRAGELLVAAAQNEARVPGSQVVLLAAPAHTSDVARRAASASAAAHALTVQGAVTSVIELGASSEGAWWGVAAAGHGNYHRASGGALAEATAAELELLSKVVARLLRVNVRLAGKTRATRIIGSRLLGQQEVKRVKAREVATDQNLSKTLGVKADRGDDDDGLQTLIPYYYGGDSHVILVELWVEEPGAVAEVSLKYKDMVELGNGTARVGVSLSRMPRDDTPAQQVVRRNVRSFEVADALLRASEAMGRRDSATATGALAAAREWAYTSADQVLVAELERLLDASEAGSVSAGEAMAVAARRRVGLPPSR